MGPKGVIVLFLGLVSLVSADSLIERMEIREEWDITEEIDTPASNEVPENTINPGERKLNNKVTIGVLSQKSPDQYKDYGQEYVMSEYIKYIEMAGGSVVIIRGAQPDNYYLDMFKKINGVLLPGGDSNLNHSTYTRSSNILFRLAKEANNKGDFFPVWGTCQGFEMMSIMVAGEYCLSTVDAENMTIPLSFTKNVKHSRLFGHAPTDVIRILEKEPVTSNFHSFCVTPKTFKKSKALSSFFRVISLNKGRKGVEFISTMEAYHYPFYAVQWHPEKNVFSRNPTQDLSRTPEARRITQYMGNFFVDEARKNYHTFPEEEKAALVAENDVRVYFRPNYIEDFFYNVTDSDVTDSDVTLSFD